MSRVDGYGHRPGEHCGSTSLWNLATFYGWGTDEAWRDGGDAGDRGDGGIAYDEPTCFGLGEGLGFRYFELPESPWRAFFGRPPWLETAMLENLGIGYEERQDDDFGAAWADLRRSVDADRPVMLFTDLYYLDYFDTSTHFAAHSLLAVGYEGGPDPGEGTVVLSDSEFDDIQELPADRLRAAITSRHVLPLECRRLWVTDPRPDRSFEDAVRRAIPSTARHLLGHPGSERTPEQGMGTHGIEGIRAFAEDLPGFLDLPDPSWAVRFAYQNVERRGTGGGAFRRLYADFLATAAARVPEVPPEAGERMAGIADAWTDLGMDLKDVSEAEDEDRIRDGLETAREDLLSIADREERLFADLLAALD